MKHPNPSIQWSDEDQSYIGRCPNLFDGGVHDEDKQACAQKLRDVIADVQGDGLKERRNKLCMNQADFAELLGVSLSTYRKYEQGVRTTPEAVIKLVNLSAIDSELLQSL